MKAMTIKYKLILIIMATCVLSQVLAGMAFVIWSQGVYRRIAVDSLIVNAAIIANQSKAAIAFDDVADAEKTLASLSAQPSVAAAELRTLSGQPFAVFLREDEEETVLELGRNSFSGYVFSEGYLIVAKSIELDDEKLGTVVVISDTTSLTQMQKNTVRIVVSVIMLVILIGYFVSNRVQGIISGPILDLTETAKVVSRDRDYSVRAVATTGDEVGVLIDAFNDMLKQVQIGQNALLKARDELEDKVHERTAELESMNQNLSKTILKLEQSNQQLQEFAHIASHDLREPLRKISSFGRLLMDSLSGKLDPDDQENFEFMIDGAYRMQQMVEALLTYSRVATHGAEFRPVDLNLIVEQLRTLELAARLEETGGQIETSGTLPTVMGDPIQLRQLLQNLVGNGLKYQARGTIPHITVSATVGEGWTRIEVRDNGIGIKEEYFNTIFTMFRRLHGRGEYEGTGIGLAVCKRIVERHNGQIGVESVFGQGSTFWFTITPSDNVVEQTATAELAELCSERV